MGSPADRQTRAINDVERIAGAIYDELHLDRRSESWVNLHDHYRGHWIAGVRRLLVSGVIKPGDQPFVAPPMTGQTSIDDYI